MSDSRSSSRYRDVSYSSRRSRSPSRRSYNNSYKESSHKSDLLKDSDKKTYFSTEKSERSPSPKKSSNRNRFVDQTLNRHLKKSPDDSAANSSGSKRSSHSDKKYQDNSSVFKRDKNLIEKYPHRYRSRSRSPRRDYRYSRDKEYHRSPSPYYSDESDFYRRRYRNRKSPSPEPSRHRRSPRGLRRNNRQNVNDDSYDSKNTSQRFLFNPDTQLWYDQETGTYSYYDETLGGYVPYEEPAPYEDASMRLIVLSSDVYSPSQLAIVDSDGLSLGRDRGNDKRLRLREMLTSKFHANIYLQPLPYENIEFINPQAINDSLPYVFCIVDCGSQHGTFVNETRLSESKKASQPYVLTHGDLVKVGSTLLEVHHHLSGLVCEHCRTNEQNVISTVPDSQPESHDSVYIAPGSTKRDNLEKERRQELKRLKRQFAGPTGDESRYCDRAALRRQANPDWSEPMGNNSEVSAVVEHAPVMSAGEKLLLKQGWQYGQGLGKQNQGIVEPIAALGTQGRNGIGFGGTQVVPDETLQQATRRIYRERFQQL